VTYHSTMTGRRVALHGHQALMLTRAPLSGVPTQPAGGAGAADPLTARRLVQAEARDPDPGPAEPQWQLLFCCRHSGHRVAGLNCDQLPRLSTERPPAHCLARLMAATSANALLLERTCSSAATAGTGPTCRNAWAILRPGLANRNLSNDWVGPVASPRSQRITQRLWNGVVQAQAQLEPPRPCPSSILTEEADSLIGKPAEARVQRPNSAHQLAPVTWTRLG